MKSKIIKTVQFVFFLLVGLSLLYFAFRGIDLDELMRQIRRADYAWVSLSVVCAVLALVFRAYRWRLLIEPLGEHPKVMHIFHAINIGYLANFVFPRIGEITRCGILNRTDSVPVDRLFGTVIVERIFDMLMTVFMLCLILLLRFEVVGNFIMQNILRPLADKMPGMFGLSIIVLILVLLVTAFIVFYRIFRAQLAGIGALRKMKGLLNGIVKGIQSVYRIRNFGLFVALNFLVFGMYFLQTYIMFFALSSTSSLGPGDALFVLVLSSLSFVIPVQGGIGAYHWIVCAGLTIFGLTREQGMVYATISHSVTSVVLILLGALSLIFVFYGKKRRKEEEEGE